MAAATLVINAEYAILTPRFELKLCRISEFYTDSGFGCYYSVSCVSYWSEQLAFLTSAYFTRHQCDNSEIFLRLRQDEISGVDTGCWPHIQTKICLTIQSGVMITKPELSKLNGKISFSHITVACAVHNIDYVHWCIWVGVACACFELVFGFSQ